MLLAGEWRSRLWYTQRDCTCTHVDMQIHMHTHANIYTHIYKHTERHAHIQREEYYSVPKRNTIVAYDAM